MKKLKHFSGPSHYIGDSILKRGTSIYIAAYSMKGAVDLIVKAQGYDPLVYCGWLKPYVIRDFFNEGGQNKETAASLEPCLYGIKVGETELSKIV